MFTRKQLSVVSSSTFAFTICFAIWMMFAVIGIPIKAKLGLNETEFGLLTAMPVLSGSLIRLPLGMLTDKLGGRIVFFILMLACVVPIWFIGDATEYWQFLVLGLFVGLAGGSFSVGIAYVARWFDKAETEQIMLWNRRYEIQEPADQYFSLCFSVAADPFDPAAEWLSTAEIFDVIKQKVGSSLKANTLIAFGRLRLDPCQGLARHYSDMLRPYARLTVAIQRCNARAILDRMMNAVPLRPFKKKD